MLKSQSIFAIGRNYVGHIKELNNERPTEPVVFLKTNAALRDLSSDNQMAFADETFDHECEVVLEIGRDITLGSKPSWDDVKGIRLGLDLTRRAKQSELKSKGLPWTLAKSFKGAGVLSPMIDKSDIPNLNNIEFSLHINGTLRQQGQTSMMIWGVPDILAYLCTFTDLRAGDLVFTGTPEGVGPIRVGDRIDLALLNTAFKFSGVL
jgi:acylpyruvate hydrolase